MGGNIDNKLSDLGIKLPVPSLAAASYVPFVKTGNTVFISGQITSLDGKLLYIGRLGSDLKVDDGYQAARLCGLNLISQLKVACAGNLDLVTQVVKLNGFVNSTQEFTEQPKVVNGASDLMIEVFGKI